MGAGMKMVVGNHRGQSQVMVVCRKIPEHLPSPM